MKKTILCLMLVFSLLATSAGAEILKLPLDFEPAPKPQGEYPAKRNTEGYDHYEDPSITADYEMVISKEWQITYYKARVKIANASQLRTAAASTFDKKALAPTQTIARRMNAVVAINGDYYTGNAGRYVLRQGQVFRDSMAANQDILLIDGQGDFHIVHMPRKGQVSTVINGRRVINALCFGPGLTENGKVLYNDAYGSAYGADWKRQRMAICQTGHLEYLCVCTGSTLRGSAAMTLDEFARFVTSLGVQTAYNLDGGDSAMMVFCGKKYNDLTSTNLRNLSDIVYFASAWGGK